MNRKYKIIDIFCGAGGLSYGFYKNNNFEIVCATDIGKDMCETYKANHENVNVFNLDIKDLSTEFLEKELSLSKNEIDIIIGGPPCQAYSTVGKRLLDDPRGKLFQEFYRLVKEVKPKIFIFENVKGLLSMNGGELFKTIINLFKEINYTVDYKVLNSANYGVPQIRERVFIVGTLSNKKFQFPEETHSFKGCSKTKKFITLEDAISDLPVLSSGGCAITFNEPPKTEYQRFIRDTEEISYHIAPKNNEKMIQLMEALPDGGSPLDIDLSLRPKSGFGNTYCRLWWKKPSTTITRNFSTPSSSRCVHPNQARPLTPREALRIQSFPDSFIVKGSNSSQKIQIGNAVPPLLSQHIAEAVSNYLLES